MDDSTRFQPMRSIGRGRESWRDLEQLARAIHPRRYRSEAPPSQTMMFSATHTSHPVRVFIIGPTMPAVRSARLTTVFGTADADAISLAWHHGHAASSSPCILAHPVSSVRRDVCGRRRDPARVRTCHRTRVGGVGRHDDDHSGAVSSAASVSWDFSWGAVSRRSASRYKRC